MAILKILVFFLAFLTILGTGPHSHAAPNQMVLEEIWNRLSDGAEVTGRCKSGYTEFPPAVAARDEPISFPINNPDPTTLVQCTLTSTHGVILSPAYQYKRDNSERCVTRCVWNIREDGVHGFDQTSGREDLVFAWAPAVQSPE